MAQHTNDSRQAEGETALSWSRQNPIGDALIKIEVHDLNAFYRKVQVLFDMNVDIPAHSVTAFIGPSGSGKSSFLRVLNRSFDLAPTAHMTGTVFLDGEDIMGIGQFGTAITLLRRRVGMLFQHPNTFPLSIFENVAYGVRSQEDCSRSELHHRVERGLHQVGLWNEVKDRLHQSALLLSLGEQQRLCLARALAVGPEVLLLDEPCAILDHSTTQMIEDLIARLGLHLTVILVTSNPRQAKRLAHFTGVFLSGRLVEYAPTHHLFTQAQDQRARAFVADHFQ